MGASEYLDANWEQMDALRRLDSTLKINRALNWAVFYPSTFAVLAAAVFAMPVAITLVPFYVAINYPGARVWTGVKRARKKCFDLSICPDCRSIISSGTLPEMHRCEAGNTDL